jgi:hypothetical protein
METTMPPAEDRGSSHPLQGQLLRRSERREVAIFLRDQALWVADFIDGQGELIDAPTWFRFNCGEHSNPHSRRRMVLESALPLSADIVDRIERLPHPATAPKRGVIGRLFTAIRNCLPGGRPAANLADRLHRGQAHPIDAPE